MHGFDAIPPLTKILKELVNGAPPGDAYILNPGDPGLFRSIEKLSAQEASAIPAGGNASVAAHVDHVRYGFELFRRWSEGEQPYATADWTQSWQRVVVGEKEWRERIESLKAEIAAWRSAMQNPPPLSDIEQNGVAGIVVHLAYHLGAIRQINRALRGPSAQESAAPLI